MRRSDPRPTLAPVLVFGAASLAGIALSADVALGHSIPVFGWRVLWQLALWTTSWIVAVAAAQRLPRRVSLALILAAAVALRLATLAGGPTTSDDLYRYAWDGRVQQAGIDPYAEPPASDRLAQLRETWLWPSTSECAALGRAPGCTRINRPLARTIYPPLAEAWFAAIYRIGGIGARQRAWQVAGLVSDLATIALLAIALRRWGIDQRWLALYALCPVAVVEIVNNAHVDGLAIALLVAALAVGATPADRDGSPGRPPGSGQGMAWRDLCVGALLGSAALVKLYPALLLVAVIGLARLRPWRSLARAGSAGFAVTAVAYFPHVLAVRWRVLGFLPGYLKEERYVGGGRFLLAGALGVAGPVATAVAGAALAMAALYVLRRRPSFPRGAAILLAVLFLATTPVQPWYALSLVAVASLAGWPCLAAIALAAEPYYFALILGYRHAVGVGRACYGLALAVAAAGCWKEWHRSAVDRRVGPIPLTEVGAGVQPDVHSAAREGSVGR